MGISTPKTQIARQLFRAPGYLNAVNPPKQTEGRRSPLRRGRLRACPFLSKFSPHSLDERVRHSSRSVLVALPRTS